MMRAAILKAAGARAVALLAVVGLVFAVACRAPEPTPLPPPAATSEPPAAVAATPTNPDRVQEVTVGPQRVDCVGSAPQMCLVVDDELFYDEIDGFEHEAGYAYRLRIEEYDRWPGQTEIPQDAGRYGYRLLAVLEKKSAAGG